jgi:hypothetical protein
VRDSPLSDRVETAEQIKDIQVRPNEFQLAGELSAKSVASREQRAVGSARSRNSHPAISLTGGGDRKNGLVQ